LINNENQDKEALEIYFKIKRKYEYFSKRKKKLVNLVYNHFQNEIDEKDFDEEISKV
jgi:hypothetical protein